MYLRIFSTSTATATAALLLVGCGVGESPEPEGDALDCAIGEGSEFASVCTLEWMGEAWASEFLIHHPEGAFRRFELNEDASGVTALDGAEETTMVDGAPEGEWQFVVSDDQYRLPLPPPSGA